MIIPMNMPRHNAMNEKICLRICLIQMRGRGGEGSFLITYMFGSKEGRGGEESDFN